MLDRDAAAAIELSRRRTKQAVGAARKAARLLAQVDTGFDSAGQVLVTDERSLQAAIELTRLALSERGAVDVVLFVGTPPTTAPRGEGDTHA